MQNTQTLAKHTRDTVEILVSPMLIQTGKPDEAEVATDQAYTSTTQVMLVVWVIGKALCQSAGECYSWMTLATLVATSPIP